MNRREAITSGALAFATLSSGAWAGEMMHDHSAMGGTSKYQPLINATGNCVAKGEACLAHCLVLLGNGDKSLADCSKAVNQMLAACGALQKLAAQGSRLVGAMAKVALEGCTECERECKKHADKHAECKACMESCTECIKQCKAFSA